MGVFFAVSLLLSVLAAHVTNLAAPVWPGVSYPASDRLGIIWLLGICAAFAGSYVTALRNLFRAIRNFDLSPGTIVLGPVFVLSVIYVGTTLLSPFVTVASAATPPLTIALVVIGCFVAGITPDVVMRSIVQRDQLKNFKREEEGSSALSRSRPWRSSTGSTARSGSGSTTTISARPRTWPRPTR